MSNIIETVFNDIILDNEKSKKNAKFVALITSIKRE